MAKVEIYMRPTCPFCVRAMALLDAKGVSYDTYNITEHPELRDEMIDRAEGRNTVPQIFIDGRGIGGCDETHALDAAGELDGLLVDRVS